MPTEDLAEQVRLLRQTNRRLNRRCQAAEAKLDDVLRNMANQPLELLNAINRMRWYAEELRSLYKTTHRQAYFNEGPEAFLRQQLQMLTERERKNYASAWGEHMRLHEANRETRRLQEENHELRVRLAELERMQAKKGG